MCQRETGVGLTRMVKSSTSCDFGSKMYKTVFILNIIHYIILAFIYFLWSLALLYKEIVTKYKVMYKEIVTLLVESIFAIEVV